MSRHKPATYTLVTEEALLENPGAFRGQNIALVGTWVRAEKNSELAGVRLEGGFDEQELEVLVGCAPDMSLHRVYGRLEALEQGEFVLRVHSMEPPVFYDTGDRNALFGELRHVLQTAEHDVSVQRWDPLFATGVNSPYVWERSGSWRRLCALLDGVLDEEFLAHEIVPYCDGILSDRWDDAWRMMPTHWVLEILQGRASAKHKLVRAMTRRSPSWGGFEYRIHRETGVTSRALPGAYDLWRWVYTLYGTHEPLQQLYCCVELHSCTYLAQRLLQNIYPSLMRGAPPSARTKFYLRDTTGVILSKRGRELYEYIARCTDMTVEQVAYWCDVEAKQGRASGWVMAYVPREES